MSTHLPAHAAAGPSRSADRAAPAPDVDRLLEAALRGESAGWPAGAGPALAEQVLIAARWHGVEALLMTGPARAATVDWPQEVLTALAARLRADVAIEALQRMELERLLTALHGAGARPLLFKGAALAYSHYPQPWCRPRVDTDLLIRTGDETTTGRVLVDLGYRISTRFGGELVTHQQLWERNDRHHLRHFVDVHSKIVNPHLFAELLGYAELSANAVGVATLGQAIRAPAGVDALLLACIHRVAHHYDGDRLIWLRDIHALVTVMTDADLDRFVERAEAKRLRAVCSAGLAAAQRAFRSPVPPKLTASLARRHAGPLEPSAVFLQQDLTRAQVLAADLRCLPWRSKLRLVREHLFPPVAYMRHSYPRCPPLALPLAYAHRVIAGAGKWFRP